MDRPEFTQLFMGDSFHMDNSDHSMTQEEIQEKYQNDNISAKEGVIAIRRQLIVESLKARGIDPSTVDIDRIIKETTPEIKKKN